MTFGIVIELCEFKFKMNNHLKEKLYSCFPFIKVETKLKTAYNESGFELSMVKLVDNEQETGQKFIKYIPCLISFFSIIHG